MEMINDILRYKLDIHHSYFEFISYKISSNKIIISPRVFASIDNIDGRYNKIYNEYYNSDGFDDNAYNESHGCYKTLLDYMADNIEYNMKPICEQIIKDLSYTDPYIRFYYITLDGDMINFAIFNKYSNSIELLYDRAKAGL